MKSFVRNTLVPFIASAVIAGVVAYLAIVAIHRFAPSASASSFTHSLLTGSNTPSDDAVLAFLPANDTATQGACGCPYCCSVSN